MIRIWSNKWNVTIPNNAPYALRILKYEKYARYGCPRRISC